MNTEIFAEWLTRQGHRIVRTQSSFWYDPAPRILQAFPYHQVIKPSPQELRRLLLREQAMALRYFTPFDYPGGVISYHVVRDDDPYELESLNPKARNKVRRGLRDCQVRPITLEQMMREGWQLQFDTLQRHGRTDSLSHSTWRAIFLTAADLPDFEAWGAFVDGQLAANVLIATVYDVCYLLYQCSHQKFFKKAANNALVYIVTRELLARPGVKKIFYSTHSLDAPASVDDFKFSMDYVPRPYRQHIQFHPYLAFLFNTPTYRMLRWLSQRVHNNVLSKAEGMIHFFLEGQLAPEQQFWPPCLADQKADLLRKLVVQSPLHAEGDMPQMHVSLSKGSGK
jgi:hypothetical protein